MSTEKNEDHLPLFRSPLVNEEEGTLTHSSTHETHRSTRSHHSGFKHTQSESAAEEVDSEDNESVKSLVFRRFHEATNSELFYDLFFVANLTVFTSVHEVNTPEKLKSYIGFFAVLWLTWYQVSLYDVRFSMDSVVDRLAKALQFGVMIGFAIVGPDYNFGDVEEEETQIDRPSWMSYRALALILMVSRFVLVLQYLQALAFTRRKFREAVLPLGAIAGVYGLMAFVYLGTYWTFTPDGANRGYIAWYVIGVVEALSATAISAYWRVISFKRTHLVQRMSLLTLIFLGEGVIGAARSTSQLLRSLLFGATPIIIGNVVALILILYFLYMLYFDWIEEKHFGTIRQQVWAFLHFPLHIALVVALEGATQVLEWTAATDAANDLLILFNATYDNLFSNTTSPAAVDVTLQQLTEFADLTSAEVISRLTTNKTLTEWLEQGVGVADGLLTLRNTTETEENKYTAIGTVFDIMLNQIYTSAGFESPPTRVEAGNDSDSSDPSTYFDDQAINANGQIYDVFSLVYIYFFVAIGLVVILIGIIAALSKNDKRALHWARLGANLFVGIALCLTAVVDVAQYSSAATDAYDNFITTPMMLPTVTLALFLAVVLNNINFLRWRNISKIGHRHDDVA